MTASAESPQQIERQPPIASRLPLLERQAPLDELGRSFRERSALGPFIIEGEPGLGKTALVNASCRLAGEEGLLVLHARGSPLEGTLHLGLVRQLLESSTPSGHPDFVATTRWLDDVAGSRQVPSGADGPATAADETSRQPHRLLSGLAAGRPVLIAIDDLHWGDEPSLRWLYYLARRLVPGQMWFVGSTIPRPPTGLGLIDEIVEEPSARAVTLQPLHVGSVRILARQHLGDAGTEELVGSCWAATGGNPRLLRAVLSAIRSDALRPETLADEAAAILLTDVARSIDERLQRVPDEARRVLDAAAVLGDGVELREVAAMAQVEVRATSDAADALADLQLLRRARPLSFRYRLERSTVLGQLGPARLAHAHARAARLLDELGAPPIRVADHLLHVEPAGEPWVADQLEQAGQALLGAGERPLALRCFARALEEPPNDGQRPRLVAALAATEASMGLPTALVHVREALDLGVDRAESVDAVLRYARSVVSDQHPGRTSELLRAIADRLATTPGLCFEVARASLSLSVTEVLHVAAGLERALGESQEPNGTWESLALGHLSFVRACAPGGVTADEVARMATASVDASAVRVADGIWVQSTCRALAALLRAGRYEQVDQIVARAQEAAAQEATGVVAAKFSMVQAISALHQGALRASELACRRALEAVHLHEWAPAALGLLAASLVAQGRTSEADDVLRLPSQGPGPETLADAVFLEQRGRLRLVQGRPSEAMEDLTRASCWAECRKIVNPIMPSWRIAASQALAALGRAPEARVLAQEELAWARSFGAPWALGAALRTAAGLSEPPAAIELLTEATEVLEGSGAVLEWARCSIALGAVLCAQGRRAGAQRHLRAGADLAIRLGAQPLAERAARELRAAGARPRRLALTGPDSLTPAERRTAELAAAGAKNAQIASLLFVSERTVQGHLSRVYRKLGLSSRERLRELLGG